MELVKIIIVNPSKATPSTSKRLCSYKVTDMERSSQNIMLKKTAISLVWAHLGKLNKQIEK